MSLLAEVNYVGYPSIEHRGWTIKHKRDFGRKGFWKPETRSWINVGFIAVHQHCNGMPGACWFESIEDAKRAIDILEDHFGGPDAYFVDNKLVHNPRYDNDLFWRLIREDQGEDDVD